MVKRKVIWDELAWTALKEAYSYIKQDSLPQAEKVKQEILQLSYIIIYYRRRYPCSKVSSCETRG